MGMINGAISLVSAAFILLLFLMLLFSPQRSRFRESRTVFALILSVFLMLLFDGAASTLFSGNEPLLKLLETLSIVASYAAEWFFAVYLTALLDLGVREKRLLRLGVGLACGIPTILYFVNLAHPFIYDLLEQYYISPVAYWCLQLPNLICIVAAILLLMLKGGSIELHDRILLSATLILPMTSFVWDSLIPGLQCRYLLVALAIAANLIRWMLSVSEKTQQTLDSWEPDRIRATLERIKPHYIYNVLTSIYYLCDVDTEVTKKAISLFSNYLRGIFNLMQEKNTVPFSRELQTVRNYMELEQMRFGDNIRVWYDIDVEDFNIPPFTVQPLVENSVRHGAEQSDVPGEILISSRETESEYLVIVRDDFEGFDLEQAQMRDDKKGSAKDYIRDILEITVGGTLSIRSMPGKGTVSIISIPKKIKKS